ncbi:hypothetical protein ANCCAN_18929 [Ancylostoma caninum]|uniref:Uncharacterized protein n=1 Tax=Ancylostoma caninum TaxID=29170 RepID=A0A368FSL5_ANCCA|nr:hypothetical protein ANCCAN_18929 [Ancylostoma caninum]
MYISQFTDALDLYVSSQICDSFFITAATSTFGWWLAFFARDQSNVHYVLDSRMHEQKLPKRELFLEYDSVVSIALLFQRNLYECQTQIISN